MMMKMTDDFENKLTAAFARANAQIHTSQEFVDAVIKRLGRINRQRWLILGGAASIGSLVAASQLRLVAAKFQYETGILADIFAVFPAETMISIVLAAIMTGFGVLLPSTNR